MKTYENKMFFLLMAAFAVLALTFSACSSDSSDDLSSSSSDTPSSSSNDTTPSSSSNSNGDSSSSLTGTSSSSSDTPSSSSNNTPSSSSNGDTSSSSDNGGDPVKACNIEDLAIGICAQSEDSEIPQALMDMCTGLEGELTASCSTENIGLTCPDVEAMGATFDVYVHEDSDLLPTFMTMPEPCAMLELMMGIFMSGGG